MYPQPRNLTAFRPQHQFRRNTVFAQRRGGQLYGIPPMYCGPPMQSCHDAHWCETCDRGFPSLDMLEKHKHQHQKCNIDGCQFIAHPKVITKHIQMQHSSGLFKKIANLNNPEDIQKWREERKKKYPTKENVERKAAEIKEKIERGEKMGLKGDMNKNKFLNGENRKRKHLHNNMNADKNKNVKRSNTCNNGKQNKKPKKTDILPTLEDTRKLKPFAGIQDLAMDRDSDIQDEDSHCNFEIDDDDECIQEKNNTTVTIEDPSVCGALSSLMCDYGSSDNEDEIKDKDIQPQKPNPVTEGYNLTHKKVDNNNVVTLAKLVDSKSNEEPKQSSDDDSSPEEVKIEKHTRNLNRNEDSADTKCNKRRKSKVDVPRKHMKRPKAKVPSTLLRKLLHREIQQERNIVLQCIRHIVNNNFFDTC